MNPEKPERSARKSKRGANEAIASLLRPFLNQDILKLTAKGAGQIPKLLQIEIIHYNEMNDKIFDISIDIDMNMCDNARNIIVPISFHRFHGGHNSTIDICLTVSSFVG
jgi:hypothetical protein